MRTRKRIYTDNLKVLNVLRADVALWAEVMLGNYEPAIEWLNSSTTNFWIWNNSLTPAMAKQIFIANPIETNAMAAVNREVLFYLLSSSTDCRDLSTRSELLARVAGSTGLSAALLALMMRKATRFEKIIATGAGTTVSPALVDYEDDVDASITVFDYL